MGVDRLRILSLSETDEQGKGASGDALHSEGDGAGCRDRAHTEGAAGPVTVIGNTSQLWAPAPPRSVQRGCWMVTAGGYRFTGGTGVGSRELSKRRNVRYSRFRYVEVRLRSGMNASM